LLVLEQVQTDTFYLQIQQQQAVFLGLIRTAALQTSLIRPLLS